MSLNLGNRSLKVGYANVPVVDNYEDIKCTWWFNADNERFYISLSALTQREIDEGKFILQFRRFKYNKNNNVHQTSPTRFGFVSPRTIGDEQIPARIEFNINEIDIRKIDITDRLLPFLCKDVCNNHPNSAGQKLLDSFYRVYKFGILYQHFNGFHHETKTGNINSTLLKVRTNAFYRGENNVFGEDPHEVSDINQISCTNDLIYIEYN